MAWRIPARAAFLAVHILPVPSENRSWLEILLLSHIGPVIDAAPRSSGPSVGPMDKVTTDFSAGAFATVG